MLFSIIISDILLAGKNLSNTYFFAKNSQINNQNNNQNNDYAGILYEKTP